MTIRFLWVEFQLKEICAQVSDNGIEETLQRIPQDMNATYERILHMIRKKPQAQCELARKALLFIAYARKPVSIDMLALAIAVKDHTQTLDRIQSSISTEAVILNSCGNLLAIDNSDSNIRCVRFVHFSVHEFLTTHHSNTLFLQDEVAHREIAQMCMTLLLIVYSCVPAQYTESLVSFANDYLLPALPHHLLAADLRSLQFNDEIIGLALLFFGSRPPLLALVGRDGDRTFFVFSAAVLALIFNLPGIHQSYNSQALNVEQRPNLERLRKLYGNVVQTSDDRLAMHYATGQLDSVAVCQRLYSHGYPIEYSHHDSDGTLNTVTTRGWSPNWVPRVCHVTPLYLVKSVEVARYLLDRGASINPSLMNNRLPNLLGYVAKSGNTGVIQFLLDSGAEQEEEAQRSALESLAYTGKVEAMRLLLSNGADPNAPGGVHGYALQAAASRNQVNAMHFLLDAGADVNALGGVYGSALQAAAYEGHVEAMQVLLDKGADVNAQGGNYGNALQSAAFRGQVDVIHLLLDTGADVHVQGGEYGNALQAAAAEGQVEVMQALLDKGADVNAQGGAYGTALQAAVVENMYPKGFKKDSLSVAEILLDHGADVTAYVPDSVYGDALGAAEERWEDDEDFAKFINLLESKGWECTWMDGGTRFKE